MLGKFGGGDGSNSSPYLVEDAFDLVKIGEDCVNKSFKLIKDIDLSPIDNWKGIIIERTKIYGDGHIIKNLKSNESGFCNYCNGTNNLIENLGIININVDVSGIVTNGVAAIVGYVSSESEIVIQNCFTSGIIKIGNLPSNNCNYCAGIVGQISKMNNQTKIENCHSDIKIIDYATESSGFNGGGILGYIGSKEGDIWKTSYTPVKNCYFNGTITFNKHYCLDNNRVIIGRNNSRLIYCQDSFFNSDLVDIMKINNFDSCNGRDNCQEGCQDFVNCGDKGKTTEEMKTASTYDSWKDEKINDETPVWFIEDGKYPKLWFEKEPLKFIIKRGNKYYTINGNELKEITTSFEPTEEYFLKNGIVNLEFDVINRNSNNENMSLLVFNENKQKIKGSAKLYLSEPFLPKDKLKQIDDGKFDIISKEVEED